jgi:hypothetical protein
MPSDDLMSIFFTVRIDYFRQLQIISDSVQDPDIHAKSFKGFTVEIAERFQKDQKLAHSIALKTGQVRSPLAFLFH